jgi:predicted dehydrogenase
LEWSLPRFRSTRPHPLDVAIIGCGAAVAGLHGSALRKLESRGITRVVALIDPDRARTAALGRHFRSAKAFATPTEAFSTTAPGLTIVASPPTLHAQHAIEALGAGSHVLCEKPMANSVDDALRMVAAASSAHRLLAIGMARRMTPSLAEARALVSAGALGNAVRFIYRDGNVYNWPVSTSAPFRRASAGGGVLIDLGSHAIDYLSSLFGTPNVGAYADDGQSDGVETNCTVALEFPAASGVVQLSWSQPLVAGLHVVGTEAEMRLNPARPDALSWRPRGGAWQVKVSAATMPCDVEPGGKRGAPRTYYDAIYYQLVQVLRAVLLGEPVPVDGANALETVRAVDACYRQATPLQVPWLPAAEQAQADARHWSQQRWLAA